MKKLTTTTERILSEDALKHIYKCETVKRRPTVESIAGALQISLDQVAELLAKMASYHLLQVEGDQFHLTSAGQGYALQVIRAHRLWERYLADETGFPEDEWHNRADRMEHAMSQAETEALSARLGHPIHDPHGDPIPTATGEFVPHGGQPLTTIVGGRAARIVHLEDEPAVIYAQLVAEGLHPGLVVRVLEASPERIRFLADGKEQVLAPILANNVSVTPLSEAEASAAVATETLADLKVGETAKVVGISPACRGLERRRLLDLGILAGTTVKAEMVSPSGDPTAYRVRGALIGLRQEQAALIHISRNAERTASHHYELEAA
jgi:DtxR family Mn-dependent transcriptional regulator